MKRALLLVAIAAACLAWPALLASSAESTLARLAHGFDTPPPEARPHAYWLWLNGYVDAETARDELRAMKEAGFSGVLLFDMGARGPEELRPPAGPAFLSPPWLRTFRDIVASARDLDLQVDFSVVSSWDLGGPWVEPRHASMGLYSSETTIQGGRQVKVTLPFPDPPPAAPMGSRGKPAFWTDVATIAVRTARLPGHNFVVRLDPDRVHDVREAVFDNGTPALDPALAATFTPVREVALAVSGSGTRDRDFREVQRVRLPPTAGSVRVPLPPDTKARYARLTLLGGHDPQRSRWTLGSFALLNEHGENVATERLDRLRPDHVNLHDSHVYAPRGVFATASPPPLQISDPEAVVDLTSQVNATGWLQWDAPAGEWTVLRYVCMNTGGRLKVPSPHSDGWETDHLNAEATHAYMEHVVARLRETFGDLATSGLRNLYLASYEVRGPLWSPGFVEEFGRRRGYDIAPYLPVLFGGRLDKDELTERFLFDYRKTLGEVLVDAYYRAARDVTNAAGLTIKSEAGGPGPPLHNVPVDALLANGALDEIQGEFWPWRGDHDIYWVVKETASAGHIYGKRLIHMEAFTSFTHWGEAPQDLKASADRVFTEGGNHMVWHTWSHAPAAAGKPGVVYHAGTHVNRNVTWWPQIKPWVDYLSRASFLLQQGTFVADVLYYYGDGGYNFVGPRRNEPSLGPGYDYDVVNMDVLLSSLTVRNGRVAIPNGSDYGILVLPDREDIHPQVLTKVEQLVAEGATVVGPKPRRASGLEGYPTSDDEVLALADRLWGPGAPPARGQHPYGKGNVVWGTPLREIFGELGIEPDFTQQAADGRGSTTPAAGGPFDFIHRRDNGTEIYFVRNTRDREASAAVTFRVAGRQPELWNPVTGERQAVAVYEITGGRTQMTLTLPGHGSTFVVFSRSIERPTWTHVHPTARVVHRDGKFMLEVDRAGDYTLVRDTGEQSFLTIDAVPSPMTLETGWTLAFPAGMGAPTEVELPSLGSWTDHDHPGIRYFSGTARYTTRFSVPQDWELTDRRVYLDLGALWSIGEVWLNGRALGIVWTDPFRVDCTEALRPGENELVVEVTNTWHNRLVGDAGLPQSQRFTRTNVLESNDKPWRDNQPIRSGLFGPVTLTVVLHATIAVPSEARTSAK